MGFRDWFRGKPEPQKPITEKRSLTRENHPDFFNAFVGPPDAGVPVTTRTVLGIPAVLAALRSVSDTIATLPLPVYRDGPDGAEKAYEHPVYRLLNTAPNAYQTPRSYRAAMVFDCLTEGEHFSEIRRSMDGSNTPRILERIDPSAVSTDWVEGDNGPELVYTLTNGKQIPAKNMLHVVSFSLDGIRGVSPFNLCKNSLSLTLALDRFGSNFVKQGCQLSGILGMPAGLSPEEREDARKEWVKNNSGSEKAGKVAALPGEYTYTPLSNDPESSQYHESRLYQLRECQRVTGVPPHVVSDYERQTYANITYSRMDFVQQSLRPVCVAIEQTIDKVLLGDTGYWAEHTLEGLLRGSYQEQVLTLSKAVGGKAFLTQNEARRLFNYPDIEGGDSLDTAAPVNPPQEDNGIPKSGE